jgi:uncharacterized protein (DUF58 family)
VIGSGRARRSNQVRTHDARPPQDRRTLPRPPQWLVVAWRTLSPRGRVVLAAGSILVVAAFLTGQQIQLRLGTLLVATPLVCLVVVSRTRHELHCSRLVAPGRVPAGEAVRVTVRVYNDATTPSSVLLAQDHLPAGLDARPRFVLDRIEPAGVREIAYRTRGRVRGRYPVGPLTVRLADPFGMCERDRPVPGTDELIVVPVVEPLAALPLTEYSPGSDNRPTTLPAAGEDDMCTREYRHGDPMHRVHWRSTARRGELMVRREEHPRQIRATVLIDVRAGAHRGAGPDSSVEWVVSACASLTAHLVRRGFAVRVLLDRAVAGRAGIPDLIPAGPGAEGPLLDALAVLETGPDAPLRDVSRELARHGGENLLIAILGDLSAEDAEDLARRRPRGATAVAFLLRPHTWEPEGRPRAATDHTALLRSGGWRTVPVEHGDTLAHAWGEALGGSGTAPATATAATATAGGAA